MKVAIVSNSPGELIGWAIPASNKLQKLGFSIDLFLTPCMFATKKEFDIALQYGKFNNIYKPFQTMKKLILQKPQYDILFHMGGELWYSTNFRTYKSFSYGWGTMKLDKYFTSYLVPNQYYYRKLISRGINISKIIKIKDLVFEKLHRSIYDPNSRLIGFMLGSREIEFWFLLKIYLDTITFLDSSFKFVFFISPFLKDIVDTSLEFNELISKYQNYQFEFVSNEIKKYEILSKVRLLITIPGTKTNEAGYLGIPQLVILPLNHPEHIPMWGLAGWLDFLGPIGKKIKALIVLNYVRKNIASKKRFIAMPNIIAQKEIIPEYYGKIDPKLLSNLINEIISNTDKLIKISQDLIEIYNEWEQDSITFEQFIHQFLMAGV